MKYQLFDIEQTIKVLVKTVLIVGWPATKLLAQGSKTEMVIPSVETSKLLQVNQFSVDHTQSKANVEIPLYSIEAGNINFPYFH